MASKQLISVMLAEAFRDAAPKELEELQRSDGEVGQSVVWLVGLASTLLTLAIASPDRLKAVSGNMYSAIVGLLLATILAGVLSRVLSVRAGRQARSLLLHLEGYLVGYVFAQKAEQPLKLSDQWSEIEIVQKLEDEFGLNYEFLIEYKTPLEGCRDAYRAVYARRKELDDKATKDLKAVIVLLHITW